MYITESTTHLHHLRHSIVHHRHLHLCHKLASSRTNGLRPPHVHESTTRQMETISFPNPPKTENTRRCHNYITRLTKSRTHRRSMVYLFNLFNMVLEPSVHTKVIIPFSLPERINYNSICRREQR